MNKQWQPPSYKLWRVQEAKGQSLVETALFLPILIVILLGIVEVSALLVNQNRVVTAGRIAAGYGAANYNGSNWNDVAVGMGQVAMNTVTDTLDLSPDLWDIWSVRALVNSNGTDFIEFEAAHVYGNQQIVSQADWDNGVEAEVKAQLIAELQAGGDADDLEVVVSIPYYNSPTFLNLPIWQWVGVKTVSSLTTMRVDQPAPFAGCAIMPIAVRMNQPSAYPTNWPANMRHEADEGGEPFFFPAAGDFSHTPSGWVAPTYVNTAAAPYLASSTFTNNVPGVSFMNARPGYVFLAREGTSAGGFGWLRWDGQPSATNLAASLAYSPPPPGNFMELYPGSPADQGGLTVPSGQSSGNGNGALEEYEWIQVNTGNVASAFDGVYSDYILTGRPVTLIYYDEAYGQGQGAVVRARGFVTVKLLGLRGGGNPKWMLFEFLRWSTECLDTGS
jgi:hypothetical protein